jgi:high-affinity iron transporter
MRVPARTFWLPLLLLAGFFATAAPAATDARTLWRLLDYVSVDYRGAVANGQITRASEYTEMTEFAATVRQGLSDLPANPAQAALIVNAENLQAAIAARETPERVAVIARGLAADLLRAYPVPLAPKLPPDVARGAALYAETCAACHGGSGAADGLLAAGMAPPPVAFTREARARERSSFALYQVIGQGLEGTRMASYAALPEDDRWALALYVGQFAYSDALAAEGQKLWQQNQALHARIPNLEALSTITPAGLAAAIGEPQAQALIAYLRRHPEAVQRSSGGSLRLTRERLAESVKVYAADDTQKAAQLALSAYLDGFEPVEPVLAAKDAALMSRIEAAMGELRARIGRKAPAAEVATQVNLLDGLFTQAEGVLGNTEEADATSAFVGAFTILLREGLEALLIVVAIIAFLRKAERSEMLPYVHAGWLGALAAGVATWAVATYLVGISGASRELTEGFGSLFAAVVLVFVGIWMHGKSQSGAWQRYIKEKLGAALSEKSGWFLLTLSFIVVYREVFETILFYAALWNQGNGHVILLGGGAAVAALAVLAWAMLSYSQRLPISQFFAFSSFLMVILAIVLTGKGIAALQEAGVVATRTLSLPRFTWLGLYPTLQGVGSQLVAMLLLIAGFAWNRQSAKRAAQQ